MMGLRCGVLDYWRDGYLEDLEDVAQKCRGVFFTILHAIFDLEELILKMYLIYCLTFDLLFSFL